jgi:hypothetical protein
LSARADRLVEDTGIRRRLIGSKPGVLRGVSFGALIDGRLESDLASWMLSLSAYFFSIINLLATKYGADSTSI